MPKDECDPEDPMELCGVALLTQEDTQESMTECFVEEFLRLGYAPAQILALFRNPHYTGMHLVWRSRGEGFVRAKITEVCGWWDRPIEPSAGPDAAASADAAAALGAVAATARAEAVTEPGRTDPTPRASSRTVTDPMGYPLPSLEL